MSIENVNHLWPDEPNYLGEALPESDLKDGYVYVVNHFNVAGYWNDRCASFRVIEMHGTDPTLVHVRTTAHQELGKPPELRDLDERIGHLYTRKEHVLRSRKALKLKVYTDRVREVIDSLDLKTLDMMLRVDPKTLSSDILLMVLTETRPLYEKLPSRKFLFEAARKVIVDRGEIPLGYYTLERP